MILKTNSFLIKNMNNRVIQNSSKKYKTLDDLMKEQNISSKKVNTVHRRRDLDSLG